MNIIYLKIPESYKGVYDALVNLMDDYGTQLLNDCSISCKNQSKDLINCWNMFQTACCSFTNDNYKKSDLLINYINTKLKLGLPKVETTEDVKTIVIEINPVINVTSSGISGTTDSISLNYGFDTKNITDSEYTEINIINSSYKSNILKAAKYTSYLSINVYQGIYIDIQTKSLVRQNGSPTAYIVKDISGRYYIGQRFNYTPMNNSYCYIDVIDNVAVLKIFNSNYYIIYGNNGYSTTSSADIAKRYTVVTKVSGIGSSVLSTIDGGVITAKAKLVKNNNRYKIEVYNQNNELLGYLEELSNIPNFYTISQSDGKYFDEVVDAGTNETFEIPFNLKTDKVFHLDFRTNVNWISVKSNWLYGDAENIIVTRLEQNESYSSRTAKIDILYNGDIIQTITVVQEANENNDWI